MKTILTIREQGREIGRLEKDGKTYFSSGEIGEKNYSSLKHFLQDNYEIDLKNVYWE
jgi:hypothetical protein